MEGVDEKALRVQNQFFDFLTEFGAENGELALYKLKMKSAVRMRSLTDTSMTVFIDYEHVKNFSNSLVKVITGEFRRFEPYLKRACHQFIGQVCPSDEVDSVFVEIRSFPVLTELGNFVPSHFGGGLVQICGLIICKLDTLPQRVRLLSKEKADAGSRVRSLDVIVPERWKNGRVGECSGDVTVGEFVSFTGCVVPSLDLISLSVKDLPALGVRIHHGFDFVANYMKRELPVNTDLVAMCDDKHIMDKLVASIAPSISCHQRIKHTILLMLVGDINVYLVGDSSSATEFLKVIADQLVRAVYISRKLTVSSQGALMFSDYGILCIDELDKMDKSDQDAIYEAMVEKTISITKDGIKAKLAARTSVLATANLIGGRYDKTKPLEDNLDICPKILQMFDLIFFLTDIPNKATVFEKYDESQMTDYIRVARNIAPKRSKGAEKYLNQIASTMTERQVGAVERLAIAFAKISMKFQVNYKHISMAKTLMDESVHSLESAGVNDGSNEGE